MCNSDNIEKRIDGIPYVDVAHLKEKGSIRATEMGKRGPYVHTCPDEVLQFLERYFDEHEKATMGGLRKAYDGPAMRIPIGLVWLVKRGRIKHGLLERIFKSRT